MDLNSYLTKKMVEHFNIKKSEPCKYNRCYLDLIDSTDKIEFQKVIDKMCDDCHFKDEAKWLITQDEYFD